ncbi:DUF2637 domain-containing protein [Prauserella marina]|uniref:Uncharacterized protein n=1 Tax=Prauserella marina TaxID=530584 RepID=A0A222VNW9_9PSEU|nr:DUF2637 domain-containing protein [Prauserella marina]ASR35552.1 DUF2637 domain-containing protein [Prauserella marina]PWV84604.1 uncharacterized protein DUF2637 [Prauserella marina]SDC17949.1 Protein of unknown function [Prauserella marina]
MSTMDKPRIADRVVDTVRVLVAIILGGIGGAVGFTHTHDWAEHHGQTGWLAWATAIVIEGMAVVAGFEIRRDHHAGKTTLLTFPVVVFVGAFVVQMAAQVELAEPSIFGWLVAAMPALGFLVVVKLLLRKPAPNTDTETTTATEPTKTDTEPQTEPTRPAQPEPEPTIPMPPTSGVRAKLPPSLMARLDALHADAHDTGRTLSAAEIQRALRLPASMAQQLATDLTPRNGHPISA